MGRSHKRLRSFVLTQKNQKVKADGHLAKMNFVTLKCANSLRSDSAHFLTLHSVHFAAKFPKAGLVPLSDGIGLMRYGRSHKRLRSFVLTQKNQKVKAIGNLAKMNFVTLKCANCGWIAVFGIRATAWSLRSDSAHFLTLHSVHFAAKFPEAGLVPLIERIGLVGWVAVINVFVLLS